VINNYYQTPLGQSDEAHQRLVAVNAALEIAKASVGSAHASTFSRADAELKYVTNGIAELADAIQAALEK
jgi:hypothetical protein